MAGLGFLYLVLTFLVCLFVVHFFKYAYLGFISSLKKDKPVEVAKEKPPEPVYYIVEKKRSKRTYSKPKEIKFK